MSIKEYIEQIKHGSETVESLAEGILRPYAPVENYKKEAVDDIQKILLKAGKYDLVKKYLPDELELSQYRKNIEKLCKDKDVPDSLKSKIKDKASKSGLMFATYESLQEKSDKEDPVEAAFGDNKSMKCKDLLKYLKALDADAKLIKKIKSKYDMDEMCNKKDIMKMR